jgi:signal transduction histidine kinase
MIGGITGRMIGATGLLMAIVSIVFALLVVAVGDMRESAEVVRHSRDRLVAAQLVERDIIDLETGLRGFVITREERYLQPWDAARASFPADASELVRLADQPGQRGRARRVLGAGMSYIQGYGAPLVSAVRQGDTSASSVVATEEGRRRVNALRAELDGFAAVERVAITASQARADADTRQATVAASVGFAGSIVLVVLLAGYLNRAIVSPVRRLAAMSGRLAGGDLRTRMPQTGVGEIGALERSFNSMAESLHRSLAELTASRARIVAAADQTRRQIERNLHDGIQQRLVSLTLNLRAVEARVPPELPELRADMGEVVGGLVSALEDLRETSRGIHPAILSEGGLGPALKTLARRSAIPVELDVEIAHRISEPVEVAAYYVAAEALTNAAKHAHASVARVEAGIRDGRLHLSVRDDGVGGADPARGSGLIGLKDRVEAIGGSLDITSPSRQGTLLHVELPVEID